MPEEAKRNEDNYYVHSTSARLDERRRVLKHGDSFAVLDRYGDVESFGRSEFGLFHRDTRFLSELSLRLRLGGSRPERPQLLSSAVKDDNLALIAHLTNPDLKQDPDELLRQGSVHLLRSQLLWRGSLCDGLRVHNYGAAAISLGLQIACGADFADIFEVRGVERAGRGELLPAVFGTDTITFAYRGRDRRLRRTHIRFDPAPTVLSAGSAHYALELPPHGAVSLRWTVTCEDDDANAEADNRASEHGVDDLAHAVVPAGRPRAPGYEEAHEQVAAELKASRAAEPTLATSNPHFDSWINRSLADLHMLRTRTEHGAYPYAGVPWFSTPFGRDGIITALQCLWFAPEMARGVLSFLAATQADELNAVQDAEPGKILHEARGGEMAALGEVPFGRYYGSIDSTPLFVMLAGAYLERTDDVDFVQSLWPNIERALAWIDTHGDTDGDGFVEYARRSHTGLLNQGWKDSYDAVFHADGTLAEGPIALCEVQGYVYAARQAAADMAGVLGLPEQARHQRAAAEALREHFESAFWCEDICTYALALDGRKQPCRTVASNAGHCLYTGITSPERAVRVAQSLMGEAGFSGWGVRTVASTSRRYNPMGYHTGSVWPHDNSLVAAGFGRYGLREHASGVLRGLFDASLFFDLRRQPELFCGFTRQMGESPTQYPLACSPQAWAAAAPLLCLQACLGLEVRARERQVVFRNPYLPPFLDEIRIHDLRVAGSAMDIALMRHDGNVGVRLSRREGDAELLVLL